MPDDDNLSHLHHIEEIADDPIPRFHRTRDLADAEMDITPMIDMTFLLLIFFLVASRIDATTSVDLPPARYGAAVPLKESVVLTVAPGDEGTARVYRGDGTDPKNEFASLNLQTQEDQIVQYLQSELATATPPRHHVIIKAARGVKHREVARVARAVGKVEKIEQLHLAVLEVQ